MTMQTRIIPNETLIPEIARFIEEGMEVTFKPKGMSMLPFIRGERDSVVLKKADSLKTGDIALAETEGSRYVLHRIERIEGETVILMGDGNIAGRERCRRSDILAVASKIIRDGKEIDCSSASHQRKAKIWKALLPVRRYLLAIYKRTIL